MTSLIDINPLDYVTCKACKGNKKINGLGNMTIDCPHCKAIGWVLREDMAKDKRREAKLLEKRPHELKEAQVMKILEGKRVYRRREKRFECES